MLIVEGLSTNIPKLSKEIELTGQISQTFFCGQHNSTIIFQTNSKKILRMNLFNNITMMKENIHKIHQSPIDNNIIIFTYSNKTSWLSKDCGENEILIDFGLEIISIEFSPRSKMEMLILSKKPCEGFNCDGLHELYHTKDLLGNLKVLGGNIIKANWARVFKSQKNKSKIPSSRIVLLRRVTLLNENNILIQETYDEFVYSDDFLETIKGLEKGIVDYLIDENNLVLIRNFIKNQENNKLLVCKSFDNRYIFEEINIKNFVNNISQIQSFGTLENEVFVFVNHHLGLYTNLYSSKKNYYPSAKYVYNFNQNDVDFKKVIKMIIKDFQRK